MSSVSVTHNGSSLSASWPGAAGASKYHVTYSSDGGNSWSLVALNHPTTSISIDNADSTKTYVVGVRARNSASDSGWVNLAPAAPPWDLLAFPVIPAKAGIQLSAAGFPGWKGLPGLAEPLPLGNLNPDNPSNPVNPASERPSEPG